MDGSALLCARPQFIADRLWGKVVAGLRYHENSCNIKRLEKTGAGGAYSPAGLTLGESMGTSLLSETLAVTTCPADSNTG